MASSPPSDPDIAAGQSAGVITFCVLFIAAGFWLFRKE
jgi:cbb3-type cytochrome oxidase subunit 3